VERGIIFGLKLNDKKEKNIKKVNNVFIIESNDK